MKDSEKMIYGILDDERATIKVSVSYHHNETVSKEEAKKSLRNRLGPDLWSGLDSINGYTKNGENPPLVHHYFHFKWDGDKMQEFSGLGMPRFKDDKIL